MQTVDHWAPWQPNKLQPWDIIRIAHLHRRTGFVPDWDTIHRSQSDGFERTVARILDHEANESELKSFEQVSSVIADGASASGEPDRLCAWWVYRMLMSPRPLVERMTLLWHNHFATSIEKVLSVPAMLEQNQLLRKHGLGSYPELLHRIVKHRAMLIWLDASDNRKEHPNENLARELMELFTLGEGHYSERDVKEAARCLTGWTIANDHVRFISERHDSGEKTVLGRNGRMNGDDLINMLLQHEATSRRISKRLCEMFFGEAVVDDPAVDHLADGLRKQDLNISWAVGTIVRSQLFWSDANIRSRVMSPVEYVIGAIRALNFLHDPPTTILVARELRRIGQDLFRPPSVFGWPDGRDWIHTRSMLSRQQFVSNLLLGRLHSADHPPIELCRVSSNGISLDSLSPASEGFEFAVENTPKESNQQSQSYPSIVRDTETLRTLAKSVLTSPTSHLS